MRTKIEKLLKKILPQCIKTAVHKQQLKKWEKQGCPIPPPHYVKQITIREYKQKFGYNVLIETGTYFGAMVDAQKKIFSKIISIELGYDLFIKAQKRFRYNKNITIVHGDSGKILPEIMKNISEPAIFWLDGHYSAGITAKGDKECPIFEELDAILDKKYNHVLLIDDARCFNGEGDYPTIEELTRYIKNKNEKYQVDIHYDIIRCVI
jgi:hypothetical protein